MAFSSLSTLGNYITISNNSTPPSFWSLRNTPSQADSISWRSIAFGNNTFVAVGFTSTSSSSYNNIMRSTDNGVTWSTVASTRQYLYSICFGNSTFVAIGRNGALISTDNGLNWSFTSVTGEWYGVCFGNSTFVAVGYNSSGGTSTGIAMRSINNGTNWTTITTVTTGNWGSVCFGNNTFVAVAGGGSTGGTNNRIMRSTNNGSSWSALVNTNVFSLFRNSICFGNNVFVACGNSPSYIITSSNGQNWTERTVTDAANYISITFGNNAFIGVGIANDFSQGKSLSGSSNGTTWTNITTPLASWSVVCFGNNTFVAIASFFQMVSV
jgi:hypothetical protein